MNNMKEVKRSAKVGEQIKVTKEHDGGWRGAPYPLNSVWVVSRLIKGLAACEGNEYCISTDDYVVLESN